MCSSDLTGTRMFWTLLEHAEEISVAACGPVAVPLPQPASSDKIGRASCRERV